MAPLAGVPFRLFDLVAADVGAQALLGVER